MLSAGDSNCRQGTEKPDVGGGEVLLQLRAGSLASLVCLLSGVHRCNPSDQQGGGISMSTAATLSCADTNKP